MMEFSIIESSDISVVGNLTGIPRKIKDTSIDLLNAIQNWNSLYIDGAYILKNIKDLKIQKLKQEGNEMTKFAFEIQNQCIKLQGIIEKMEEIICRMNKINDCFKAICELHSYQDYKEPIFQVWSTQKFYDTSNEILRMYREQFLLCKFILNHMAYLENEDKMSFYIITWIHKSKITDKSTLILHCLKQELGLS